MKIPLEDLTEEQFEILKSTGMLWEIFPDAPDVYSKIERSENA